MGIDPFALSWDPGPSFVRLLEATGQDPLGASAVLGGAAPVGAGSGAASRAAGTGGMPPHPHGTTIVALRYRDGVVMAADRRATEGHLIAHRSLRKLFPADRRSGIAIAGAAGPAMEMVRLFQTQLEHYEKVEGSALSLEGKANQLAGMIRGNLGMAMQGLVVIPLFAGYDERLGRGRIFNYDVTGGRYEEADFHATGSGGRDARSAIKLGWSDGLERERAVELAIAGLWEAADEDSATGGPDLVRQIFPTAATITREGFAELEEPEVADRFRALLARKGASA